QAWRAPVTACRARVGPCSPRGRATEASSWPGDAAGEHSAPRACARRRRATAGARASRACSAVRQLQRRPGRLHGRPAAVRLEALLENALADLDDLGVELGSGAFVEASQCFLSRQPLAIRTIGGHGVIRVADENDP